MINSRGRVFCAAILVAAGIAATTALAAVHQTITMSPDGHTLAGVDDELRCIVLWNVDNGARCLELPRKELGGAPIAVAFSPNGACLAVSIGNAEKCIISLRDPKTGKLIRNLEGHGALTGGTLLAFSPKGKYLVASGFREISVWSVKQGEHLLSFHGHKQGRLGKPQRVDAVAFSPDESVLATSGQDRLVRFWHMPDGAAIREININATANGLAFSPDGEVLASGEDRDDIIRLWKTADGTPVRTLRGHEDDVQALVFLPDAAPSRRRSQLDRHARVG